MLFKRQRSEAISLPKFFPKEKVGFQFPVNWRETAVYSDDSVAFSSRHAC